jgi:hypothetical protein
MVDRRLGTRGAQWSFTAPNSPREDDMSNSESRNGYLDELADFLAFANKLWGILAGISVFFPLSNMLLEAIPLGAYGTEGGVFDRISPPLITTITTVVTLFLVLATFAGRSRFARPGSRRATVRKAWLSLAISVVSLIAYLALYQAYFEYAWEPWRLGSGDPRKLIVEIPLTIAYAVFFALLTKAFMLLGMLEFFENRNAWVKSAEQDPP